METACMNVPGPVAPTALTEPTVKLSKQGEHFRVSKQGTKRLAFYRTGENQQLPDALFNDADARHRLQMEKPWHRAAINMAQNGMTDTEIATALGVHRCSVKTVLRQPWARERMINEIKKNTQDELRNMIEKAAPEAILEIVDLSKNARSETVKLAANRELLDRFMGRPNQPISTTSENLTTLSDTELERIATSGTGAT